MKINLNQTNYNAKTHNVKNNPSFKKFTGYDPAIATLEDRFVKVATDAIPGLKVLAGDVDISLHYHRVAYDHLAEYTLFTRVSPIGSRGFWGRLFFGKPKNSKPIDINSQEFTAANIVRDAAAAKDELLGTSVKRRQAELDAAIHN